MESINPVQEVENKVATTVTNDVKSVETDVKNVETAIRNDVSNIDNSIENEVAGLSPFVRYAIVFVLGFAVRCFL